VSHQTLIENDHNLRRRQMARFLPSFSERVQQSLDQDEQRQNNEHDEQNNYIEEDSMIEEVPALDASTSDSSESTPSDENSLDSENSFLVLPEHRLEMGLTPPYAQKGFDRYALPNDTSIDLPRN
jgi:hypothetical protein